MTISVTCACGANYKLKPEAAGKRFQCPKCDAVLTVRPTAPSPPQELVDDDYIDEPEAEDYEDYGEVDERSRRGERLGCGNGRHRIAMSACETSIEAITPKRLQNSCDELLQYLAASPNVFKQSEIRLTVRSTVKNANQADVQIRLSGSVNGRPLGKTVEGRARKVSNSAAIGMSGGLVGALIGAAIDRATSKKGGPHKGLQQEFAKIRHALFEACDKAAGRQASKASGRWRGIQIGAGVAAAVAFIAFFAFLKLRGEPVVMSLIAAAFLIAPAMFGVLAVGLTAMPDSFFLRDAVGRRAMRLSGGSSPGAARIIGAITAVLMLALAVGIVLLSVKLNK
jgi:hypothetical protein